MEYCYEYPRPALTADIILLTLLNNKIHTLLIQRKNDPFAGCWAFPGGFVDEDENAHTAAIRELEEETNLKGITLTELFTDSELNRDPRGRTVSVVFYGFIDAKSINKAKAGDDAANVNWFPIDNLPELAFDHKLLQEQMLARLAQLLVKDNFGFNLLGETFKLSVFNIVFNQVFKNESIGNGIFKRLEHFKLIIVDDSTDNCKFNLQLLQQYKKKGISVLQ